MNTEAVRKMILIILCGCGIAAGCVIGSRAYALYRTALVRTVVAARDIPPRTRISIDDVTEIYIPEGYLLNACRESNEVVGKYTEIQGMIPAGSPFYDSMLFDASELPDQPELQLRKGQAVYSLETDLSDAGILTGGQRVDLYVSVERENNVPVTGNLLEHVRVIAVRDHKGREISETGSEGVPHLILLAVGREDIDLLNMAEMTGTVRVFASSDAYSKDAEAERAESSPVLSYLLRLIQSQTEEKKNPET